MMVKSTRKADSRGKAAVEILESSEDSRAEFHCPSCSKTFRSIQSLCAHQNAHRRLKEPMKMSPVLAAVLNNPLPPFHKPFLIPPRSDWKADLVEANKAAARELGSTKPAAYLSPRYHPYNPNPSPNPNPNQHQVKNKKKKTTTTTSGSSSREGGKLPKQLLRNQPGHRQIAAPDEKKGKTAQTDTAMDQLGEWRPVTIKCYRDDECRLEIGRSSGNKLSGAVSRKFAVEVVREPDEPLPDLELGLRPPGHLDLSLKLGF